jgi:GNAT superfamily N-acetyltransferase
MATIETEEQGIEVRSIELNDAPAISQLCGQLGYDAAENEVRQRVGRMLPLREDHLVLVACFEGQVIGWIEAEIVHHLQSPAHGLITGLVVRERMRSLGVGKRLCREVESWVAGRGVSLLRVTSRMTRERAHRFYLRDGFVQIKTSAVFEKVLSGVTP